MWQRFKNVVNKTELIIHCVLIVHLTGPEVCVVLAPRNLFNRMAAVESRTQGLNSSFENVSEVEQSVFYSPV